MLFYGPPGTGKTSIMKLVLKISGLTKIVEPFGSSDLNRGLVGETEALIRDIFKRAEYFPYLLCCIIIDEIDSLVPSRESKCLSSSNSSNVNQLLALVLTPHARQILHWLSEHGRTTRPCQIY